MTRKLLLASAATLLLPAAAMAQDQGLGFNGVVTLSYSVNNNDLADYDSLNLSLDSEIVISPNFMVGFDLDTAMLDVDIPGGPGVDLDWSRFALEPTYNFGNGFSASVYYQSFEVDLSISTVPVFNIGTDIESYGVAGQYAQDNWYVGAYFGQSDTDPGLGALGIDIDDYGLNGGITLQNGLGIYGQYAVTSVSIPGTSDLDVDLISVGADYTFDNGVLLYGSIARVGIDIPIPGAPAVDPTQFSIGVGYDLSNLGAGIPAMAHFEVAHTSLDLPAGLTGGLDDDVTKITLGINFALGGGTIDVPLDSAARLATGEIRSALLTSLNGLF